MEVFGGSFSCVINLLLIKCEGRSGRISALGRFCTDLGLIFSLYGSRAWLISHISLICTGDISIFFHFRETVSERLKDQEDGVFIVRDSRRFPGEYTLTLRYIEFIVE